MKRSLIKSGLVGAFALALSAAAALAQPNNLGGSEQHQLGAAGSPLVQVRGDFHGGGGGSHGGGFHGGGFHGGGSHGGGFHGHSFHGRHFGGFDVFGGPSFYDYGYYGDDCHWSPRYHRTICY